MSRDFRIGRKPIGDAHPVFVIAEIGINHEGDVGMCRDLVLAAAEAGVDAIKLQTVDPDESYVPGTESFEIFRDAELSPDETAEMFTFARDQGMEPFTTAGDPWTLAAIDELDPAAHKISSGLLTHLPLIEQAAATGRPLILSTGMAELADVDAAVAAARQAGGNDLAVMQCTSIYPAPPETLNLGVIRPLGERYGIPSGFSDHSLGIAAAPLAVAAGACLIEKHLTLDSGRPGFDHAIALEPPDLARLVTAVREAEVMRGSREKHPTSQEREQARRFRRSLVARADLPEGTALNSDNVAVMRTELDRRGLPPAAMPHVVGRHLAHDLKRFDPILDDDLLP